MTPSSDRPGELPDIDDGDLRDEPDSPLAETDVNSAARSCSVILLIIAGVVAIGLIALVIALING